MAYQVWNKGKTKEDDASVAKISQTMKSRRIDNFAKWREKAKETGKIKSSYPAFVESGDLAELIGTVLGDGYIGTHPRTESLRIVGDSQKPGFILRSAMLIETVFEKKPNVTKRNDSNAVNISIYEKHISKRLGITAGALGNRKISVPRWILKDEEYIRRYLRGLYESDGSFSVHYKTYTHKFIFKNVNDSLLNIVERLVKRLGFHPHRSKHMVQVSRKEEVYKLKELLQYMQY